MTDTQRLQCKYFIKKKNRQCGMTRKSNHEYCSEHLNNTDNSERIPCPLDPNHTVNEKQLQKHLFKCNKFKLKHINDNMSYYHRDLNTLPHQNNIKIQLNDTILNKTIDILLYSYTQSYIPMLMKQNPYMSKTRFNNLENQKHAIQQSSLIQNLLEFTTEIKSQMTLIEYGSGRGEFSRYFNQVIQSLNLSLNKIILIDRASNRLKFDNKIISDSTTPPQIKRVKIDIKDLYIDDLLSNIDDKNDIIISKHLCGVATDLTLRSIVNNPLLKNNINSICIAMCCRHVCNPDQYINKPFIENILIENNNTLTYDEFFFTLTKLCSWATNGKRVGVQDCDLVEITPNRTITIKEREKIGLMARNVIDQGRLQWVKENLPHSKAQLIHYVSKDISLENVALLLTK